MAPAELRRDLGLPAAIAVIVGSMIGSGILILPGTMGALVGNSGLLLLAWVLPGFLTIAGALTFAEMASAYPRAGGQYVFLREGMGPAASYLYGWSMFWVIQTGIIAAVAIAFASFVDLLVGLPGALTPLGPLTLPKWGVALVAVACIAVLSAVNYLGVKHGGTVQVVSTAAKVAGIAALIVGVFVFAHPAHDVLGSSLASAPTGFGAITAFGLAVTLSLFAYDGWPQATYIAAEVKDARRNLPRALVIGPLLVMAIYVLAVAAYIYALPILGVAATGTPGNSVAAEAAGAALGPDARTFILVVAMVSTFGTVNAYVLASPRVFYAMGRDGALLPSLAKLDPRTATPALAILFSAEWASLLLLTGTYAQTVTVVVFAIWTFYIPTMLAYFRIHKDPRVEKPFRTPGYPWVPLAFLGAALFIVLDTLVTAPVQAALALLLVGAGVPAYGWQARRSPSLAGREVVLEPLDALRSARLEK